MPGPGDKLKPGKVSGKKPLPIDRSLFAEALARPINYGDNVVSDDISGIDPNAVTPLGHKYYSGSAKGGDLVTTNGKDYFIYNKQGNTHGLVNIGSNPFKTVSPTVPVVTTPASTIVSTPSTTIATKQTVDPNYKPMVFGQGQNYNPNTGKYYNPDSGAEITPIVTGGQKEIPMKETGLKKGGLVKNYGNGGKLPENKETNDSTLENLLEIVDPTGISSWDDVSRSYNKNGMSGETMIEILGALPLVGKIGKGVKAASYLGKGIKGYDYSRKGIAAYKALQAASIAGKTSDAAQAYQQHSDNDNTTKYKKGGLVKNYSAGGFSEDPLAQMTPEEQEEFQFQQAYNEGNAADDAVAAKSKADRQAALAGQKKPMSQADQATLVGVGVQGTEMGASYLDSKNQLNEEGYTDVKKATGSAVLRGAGKGAGIGASIGSVIPGVGTGIGAAAGAAIGGIAGGITGNKKAKAFNEEARLGNEEEAAAEKARTARTSIAGALAERDFADGGKVTGPGTGTSDSITKKKIKPGAFVVPAKNAEVAEELREKVLGDNPDKKANLNQYAGKPNANLSNGEHIFTPEEVKELTAKGIDLNKLAPEAKTKLRGEMDFAGGGKVGEDKFEATRKAAEADLKKKYPGKDVKVIYKGETRSLAEQAAAKAKGSSTTKIGLHNVGGARDFNIIIDGRTVGNSGEDLKLYKDYVWSNAKKQGLHHLDEDGFGATDPYHIGLVEERGDSTAFKRLIETYPTIKETEAFKQTMKDVADHKKKNPKDTVYDNFIEQVSEKPKEQLKGFGEAVRDDMSRMPKAPIKAPPVTKKEIIPSQERAQMIGDNKNLQDEIKAGQTKADASKAKNNERAGIYNQLDKQVSDKKSSAAALAKAEAEYKAILDSYETFKKQSDTALNQNEPYRDEIGASSRPDLATVQKNQEELLRTVEARKAALDKAKKDVDFSKDERNYIQPKLPRGDSEFAKNVREAAAKTAPVAAPKYKIDPASPEIPNADQINKYKAAQAAQAQSGGIANNVVESSTPKQWREANVAKEEAETAQPPQVAPPSGGIANNVVAPVAAPVVADTTTTAPPSAQTDKVGGILSAINGASQYLLPAVQTGMGFSAARELGKRPVGEIDADYLNAIDEARTGVKVARADAKFGMTPAAKFAAEQDNQNLLNAERYTARSMGGGPANSINLERSAINNSFGRGIRAMLADEQLKLSKQGRADDLNNNLNSMIANKAGMSRQLFGDTLNAYNDDSNAAGALIGSGLNNAIAAGRYNNELEYAKKRDAKYNK